MYHTFPLHSTNYSTPVALPIHIGCPILVIITPSDILLAKGAKRSGAAWHLYSFENQSPFSEKPNATNTFVMKYTMIHILAVKSNSFFCTGSCKTVMKSTLFVKVLIWQAASDVFPRGVHFCGRAIALSCFHLNGLMQGNGSSFDNALETIVQPCTKLSKCLHFRDVSRDRELYAITLALHGIYE